MPSQYYPILLTLGIAMFVGFAILMLSYLLGKSQIRGGTVHLSAIESGLPLLDRSHKRLSIVFFLVAIDFIIFDLEAAFLFPWALHLREGGWPLFWAVMVFVGLILVGYAYVWAKGGLNVMLSPKQHGEDLTEAYR
ncbi:MAG TPA: NADH-quinone oxidoreductase subunit A [Thermoanaerobaculia bacterium]|nr:NADH-quinone oxidoreductase subunit A [Thermoanaerobaculia bacterium]